MARDGVSATQPWWKEEKNKLQNNIIQIHNRNYRCIHNIQKIPGIRKNTLTAGRGEERRKERNGIPSRFNYGHDWYHFIGQAHWLALDLFVKNNFVIRQTVPIQIPLRWSPLRTVWRKWRHLNQVVGLHSNGKSIFVPVATETCSSLSLLPTNADVCGQGSGRIFSGSPCHAYQLHVSQEGDLDYRFLLRWCDSRLYAGIPGLFFQHKNKHTHIGECKQPLTFDSWQNAWIYMVRP